MGQPTTWISALKSAKRLVGSFSNCRPSDPDQFAESVAHVLEKYPVGLVDECCDPQRGLALKVEFLSLKALHEWCEARKADYTEIAFPRLPPPEGASDPTMAERCCKFLADVANVLRGRNEPSPLDRALEERTAGRRLRLDEVRRLATEAPLSKAEYKPLCDWTYRPSKSGPAA